MGYKCANCGYDAPSRRDIVEHMLNMHNSAFVDGEEGDKMVKMSKEIINKNPTLKARHQKVYDDAGEVL